MKILMLKVKIKKKEWRFLYAILISALAHISLVGIVVGIFYLLIQVGWLEDRVISDSIRGAIVFSLFNFGREYQRYKSKIL